MGSEISRAELQLCMAVKNIQKPLFTEDDLRAFGAMAFKDALEDWSVDFERLCGLDVFRAEGENYRITGHGQAYVERVIASEFFGKMLLRAEQSKAFGCFCERVYGQNLTQFGTADMNQLSELAGVLSLSEQSQVLDAGCGIGTLAEYLSDVTGAKITGVDSAEPAIERAIERTRDKLHRLNFQVGDINHIDFLPAFDAVISVDTLYFAKDISVTISQMKAVLKAGGQMGLFFTEVAGPNDTVEMLAADQTRLARALRANDLGFEAHDLTESNVQFWRRSQQVAEQMLPEFEAEGSKELCEGRMGEGAAVLALADAGRMSRYLYHVTL